MLSQRSFAALVACAAAIVSAEARAQTLTILHHERLGDLEFVGTNRDATLRDDDANAEPAEAFEPAALRAAEATSPRIRFTAFGREFSAVLEPNDRLLQGLAPKQRAALREIELYRGKLDGAPSSWVRLSRHRGRVSGAIWDGFDLYGIEPAKRVRAALAAPADETDDEPIIFRYRDTIGALSDELIVRPADEDEPIALPVLANLQSALPGISQLDIGLVADFEFFEYAGNATALAMLDAIHVADGIFVEQVGLHLNVATIVVHEEDEDPFSGRDGQELLRDLETYKGGRPDLAELGLLHLFTARPLTPVGRPDGYTLIGLANLGSVCRPAYSTSLVDGRYQPSGLITAHEIAHVLGAPHDGEGACVGAPTTYLMAPILNHSQRLSQCSIEQISSTLADATCLKPLSVETDVAIREGRPTSDSVLLGDEVAFELIVDNRGTKNALDVLVEIDGAGVLPQSVWGLADFDCETPDGSFPWRCWTTSLPSGTRSATLRAIATHVGTAMLSAKLSAANAAESVLRKEIEVLPAVELAFSDPPVPPPVLTPGRPGTTSIELRNRGLMDATNVEVRIHDSTAYLELQPRVVGGSACVMDEFARTWTCPIGTLGVGEHRSIEIDARARDDLDLAPGSSATSLIDLTASADQENRSGWNRHQLRLQTVRWIADLRLSVIPPAAAMTDTEMATGVIVENLGPDTAIDVAVSYYDFHGRIEDVILDGVDSCERLDPLVVCTIESLELGESAGFTVRSRAPDRSFGEIDIEAWSASHDPFTDDNMAFVQYDIDPPASHNPPPPPPPPPSTPPTSSPSQASSGGGGGGGAFGVLTLIALTGVLIGHRTRLRHRGPQAGWPGNQRRVARNRARC